MDRDQLIAFERIVRLGSFSGAARSLNLTQPTITARLQALEQEVGGPLFVRGGRQLQLTERGTSFLPYARRILELLTEGIEAAELTQTGQRGQIRLGVTESLTGGFLAATLAQLYQTHPQVEFFFRTGHTSQVVEMLHDGLVKLGLLTWPYFSPNLQPLLTFREELALVVPPNHPLAKAGAVTLAQAADLLKPFYLIRWSQSSMSFMAQLNLPPREVLEIPLETVRALLRRGLGASLLPPTVVADELAGGKLLRINLLEASPLYRESALVRLANSQSLSTTLKEFIILLEQEARHLSISVNGKS